MLWLLFVLAMASSPAPASPPQALPDSKTERAEYVVDTAARSTQVYVLPPGPRTVRSLEIEPTPATADAWRTARLRLFWEGDDPDPALAAFDLPLGLVFGRSEGHTAADSEVIGTSGTVWVNRLPMPYRTGGLLRVDSESPLKGTVRVRTSRGTAADPGYLRASVHEPARGPFETTGKGRLAGAIFLGDPAKSGNLLLDGRPVGFLSDAIGFVKPRGDGAGKRVLLAFPPAPGPLAFTRTLAVEKADPTATAAFFWYADRPAPVVKGR